MTGTLISFSGSHGTGKSTAAYEKAVHLKILHPDKSIYALCDQEALCPYPINKRTTPAGQLWIFTRQINQELFYLSKFDIVVTDRTAVDIIAYTMVAGFSMLASDMFVLAQTHILRYQEIIFRKIVTNEFCCQDGIRESTDGQYRQQVEDTMLDYYRELIEIKCLQQEDLRYV